MTDRGYDYITVADLNEDREIDEEEQSKRDWYYYNVYEELCNIINVIDETDKNWNFYNF